MSESSSEEELSELLAESATAIAFAMLVFARKSR